MYNLTVDQAHTFFVGAGQWLVHNRCTRLIENGNPPGINGSKTGHTQDEFAYSGDTAYNQKNGSLTEAARALQKHIFRGGSQSELLNNLVQQITGEFLSTKPPIMNAQASAVLDYIVTNPSTEWRQALLLAGGTIPAISANLNGIFAWWRATDISFIGFGEGVKGIPYP